MTLETSGMALSAARIARSMPLRRDQIDQRGLAVDQLTV
jgi:hypothetical protein